MSRERMKKIGKALVIATFVLYLLVLILLLFARTGYWQNLSWTEYVSQNSNFVPFSTIAQYFKLLFTGGINASIPLANLAGNLFMMAPMGLYLPYLFKRARRPQVFFLTMLCLVLSVELAQTCLRIGSLDIDDVILNLVGAFLGYGVGRLRWVRSFVYAE